MVRRPAPAYPGAGAISMRATRKTSPSMILICLQRRGGPCRLASPNPHNGSQATFHITLAQEIIDLREAAASRRVILAEAPTVCDNPRRRFGYARALTRHLTETLNSASASFDRLVLWIDLL